MLSLLIFSFIAMLTLTNKTLGIAIIITIFTTVLTLHSTLKIPTLTLLEMNYVPVPQDIEAYKSAKATRGQLIVCYFIHAITTVLKS